MTAVAPTTQAISAPSIKQALGGVTLSRLLALAKAAQAFVDYMLSKDGQQGVADKLVLLAYQPSTRQNDFFTGVDKVKQVSSPTKFQQLAKDPNLTYYQDFAKKELNVR